MSKQFYFKEFSLALVFYPYIGPYQELPRAKVDLKAVAMKEYSAFPKAPALLEPHRQNLWCHIQDSRLGVVLPLLQRSSWCILQTQPVGPERERV